MRFNSHYFNNAILICLQIILGLLLRPWRPILYEDDFAWALQVRQLIESGTLELSGFAPVSQLFQLLWGWLFCLPFGFSFRALNVSTFILSTAILPFFYFACNRLCGSKEKSLYFSIFLALFPGWLLFSMTFMSEVVFSSLLTAALCASIFALEPAYRERQRAGAPVNLQLLWLSSLFFSLAALVRVHSLIFAISFVLVLLYLLRRNTNRWMYGIVPMVLPVAALSFLGIWILHDPALSFDFLIKKILDLPISDTEASRAKELFEWYRTTFAVTTRLTYKSFLFFEVPLLISIPILAMFISRNNRMVFQLLTKQKRIWQVSFAMGLCFTCVLLFSNLPGDYFHNIFQRRSNISALTYSSYSAYRLWIFFSPLALVVIFTLLLVQMGRLRKSPTIYLLLFGFTLYWISFLPVPAFLDSYLVPMLLPAILFLLATLTRSLRINRVLAVFVLALGGFFSVNSCWFKLDLQQELWDIAGQYKGKKNTTIGNLSWIGWNYYNHFEALYGFDALNISKWNEHINMPPPSMLVVPAGERQWYNRDSYNDPLTGKSVPYTSQKIIKSKPVSTYFLRESILFIEKR